jgi:hypothetical protein
MPTDQDDPFFIGWLPAPAAHRRLLRPLAAGLLLGAVAVAAVAALGQRDPGPGHWDAGRLHSFDGWLVTRPYALLWVPGAPGRTFLLVEEGKFGALPRAEPLTRGWPDGRPVRATGTVLDRDGRWMLELAAGPEGLRPLTAEEARALPPVTQPTTTAEDVTLAGEIIDPKCYLGAMRPGGGKTHKACAMLCISGGVPPMLVTRDAGDREANYLLTTAADGPANDLVLPFVGEPIRITGRLERRGDLLLLRIEADGLRRR